MTFSILDRWTLVSRNATKTTMFRCHRMRQARYRKNLPAHAIHDDALCPVHSRSVRRRVRARNDVCKLHAVYQRRQYSPEGKNSPLHSTRNAANTNCPLVCLTSRCDIPRTPHRRTQEMPAGGGGSRTAPRPMNGLNSSIVGIGESLAHFRLLTLTDYFSSPSSSRQYVEWSPTKSMYKSRVGKQRNATNGWWASTWLVSKATTQSSGVHGKFGSHQSCACVESRVGLRFGLSKTIDFTTKFIAKLF